MPEGLGLSRSRVQALIGEGAVSRADGRVLIDPRMRVEPGAELVVTLPPALPARAAPEAIPLQVVFEDSHLIVIDKPVGLVVHPAPGAPRGTLVNALLHHCGDSLSGVGGEARPGIVHRIDKDTSGLLVVAKSDAAHQGLAAQFAAHAIERRYLAVLRGSPDRGDPRLAGLTGVSWEAPDLLRIEGNIGRHPGDRKRMAVLTDGESLPSPGCSFASASGRRRHPRPRWRSVGSRPGGLTRSASTWPSSAIPSSATRFTAAGAEASELPRFGGRRCTRRCSAFGIR